MLAAKYPRPFGVEEEYLLLDAADGRPVDRAAELILAMPERAGQTEHEYFTSQIETATPVCHEAYEAEESLMRFRVLASREASFRGVVLAGTGLPATGGETAGTVSPKRRYHLIELQMREAAAHQYSTGMHVHVEVPSPDAGIEVLARLARWAPVLLAMTANSPLWCGETTGFASWRHVMGLAWPVSGYPHGFENAQDYLRSVASLIETGIVPDAGLLTWVARLSANYPTVELRIADAQLEARDAVAFAVIVRALVDRALADYTNGISRPQYPLAIVNGANWTAARNGLGSELIDPLSAESSPAFDLVDRMLGTIETELDRFGDRNRIDRYLRRLREGGDPANRQRAAYESAGMAGLLELYRAAGVADAAA
ncbi:carboxylate-amine ligase [Gulosibacter sediminis]|uniref:carboxylate-amine ligase n=1 Tax=Gulosibacter sediminis TaxID=1729695 RepID=UPI0024AC82EC|nr:YbdK family carboxylate-amine ligase [Gulosibacter sediminis]